jgi:hypothetical protein
MMYGEYRQLTAKALKAVNLVHMRYTEDFIAVLDHLPTEALQAVVDGKVIEDNSVLLNNPLMGKPVDFYPFWINLCDEELVERMFVDKS